MPSVREAVKEAAKIDCCPSCHEDQGGGYAPYGECFVYADKYPFKLLFKACCCSKAGAFEDAMKAERRPDKVRK
jgi:hypothetical protein